MTTPTHSTAVMSNHHRPPPPPPRTTTTRTTRRHSSIVARVLVTAVIYVLFTLCFVISLLLQGAVWILLFPLLMNNEKIKMWLLSVVFHYNTALSGFFLNPFWRLEIVRHPPSNYKPGKTILMANHLSGADPFVVTAATFPWDFKFIYKADLVKIPLAGWAVYMGYDIGIKFTKEKGGWGTEKGSVSSLMKQCKRYGDLEMPVAVFPEGTRSRSGGLQPFKDGFFKLAIDNQTEILPCAIHNSGHVFPMGSRLFDYGTVYVAFGDPIRSKPGESVAELRERVRTEIYSLLSLCPLHDPKVEQLLDEAPNARGLGIHG